MIAQVTVTKLSRGLTDDEYKAAEEMMRQSVAIDGCEGAIDMTDPSTGDSVTVVLFRDQAALEAFQAFRAEKLAEFGDILEYTLLSSHVYPDVLAVI